MNISERVVIGASIDEVWDFVTDVPRVGSCLPGTEHVTDLGDGAYGGAMRVKVGAIAVRLEGKVRMVERDETNHVATLAIEAVDKRVKGSVNATTTMTLAPVDGGATELAVDTDAAVAGKLGQFGQAVIQKKTKQILDELVENMTLRLQGGALPEAADAASIDGDRRTAGDTGRATVTIGRAPAPAASPVALVGSSGVGLLIAASGIAVGVVGAAKSDIAWSLLGLSLVTWGSFGFPRRGTR